MPKHLSIICVVIFLLVGCGEPTLQTAHFIGVWEKENFIGTDESKYTFEAPDKFEEIFTFYVSQTKTEVTSKGTWSVEGKKLVLNFVEEATKTYRLPRSDMSRTKWKLDEDSINLDYRHRAVYTALKWSTDEIFLKGSSEDGGKILILKR